MQALHMPPLHTMLSPHGVPSATFVGLGHVDAPVAHDVVPDWHGLPPGEQAAFAMHEAQVPLPSHTMLVPQAVPAVALFPVSVHEKPPSSHTAVPVWHGLPIGAHGALGVQAPHAPLLQ